MSAQIILFDDSAFKYTGVWQENGKGEIVSYHTSAQLEFGFTGSEIKLYAKTENEENILFLLDGDEISPEKESENIFNYNTSCGEHILKVVTNRHAKIYFKGVSVSDGERIFATKDNYYIQFIGDSITDACPGFSTAVADNLKVDYSIVSLCGIALVDKWGWYKLIDGADERIGMETTYFSLQNPQESVELSVYDFKNCRKPDAFVIYLGTNDYISRAEQAEEGNCDFFAERYYSFVKKIKNQFGEKPFFILQTHRKGDNVRVKAINKAYELIKADTKTAYLLNPFEWDIELTSDGVHPSANGYKTMTENVTAFLKEKLHFGN